MERGCGVFRTVPDESVLESLWLSERLESHGTGGRGNCGGRACVRV